MSRWGEMQIAYHLVRAASGKLRNGQTAAILPGVSQRLFSVPSDRICSNYRTRIGSNYRTEHKAKRYFSCSPILASGSVNQNVEP